MSESDKYDILPCKAEIVINEQYFRHALSNHLSAIGYCIATDHLEDLSDLDLAGCITIDGVARNMFFFSVVLDAGRGQGWSIEAVPCVMFEDGLSVAFNVTLKDDDDITVEQLLFDPSA